jgi:drug/metabolite transporter (DMT)-like permease
MLAFSALVAGSFSLGALAAPLVDPAALSALRFLLAGLLVGVAALATTGLPRSAWVAPWRYLILGGLLAAYFVLMFEGLKTAPPVSAAAVFTLTPVLAAGFGWLLLRQRLTSRMGLALAIGAVGALWVIFRADLSALLALRIGPGEVTYFWGCVAHALYAPMVRKLNRGEPAVVFTFGMMVAGTALLTLWAWPAIRTTDWAALPRIV